MANKYINVKVKTNPNIEQSIIEISNFNSDIVNKSFVLYNYMNYSPCVYIYKNVTNNKIYDIVNFLFEDDFLSSLCKSSKYLYTPVIASEKIREVLSVDENWEHDGYVKITGREGFIGLEGSCEVYSEVSIE